MRIPLSGFERKFGANSDAEYVRAPPLADAQGTWGGRPLIITDRDKKFQHREAAWPTLYLGGFKNKKTLI